MYYSRGHADYGDGREMPPKRQRMMDQGSSYYGGLAGPSFMYNAPPYAAYANQPPSFPVVKLRGLPFDCTEADIAEFFHGLDIVDVVLVHKGSHFTGEAYCLLGYPMQVDFALQRNRQNIGRRYIEVFRSKKHDYYRAIANEVSDGRSGSSHRSTRARSFDEAKDLAEHTGILRMRGLPYSATKESILDFFKNFALSEDKIHITYNSEGRPSGEAFVDFSDPGQSRTAMSKDRMTLGNRYVELFASNHQEMDEAIAKGRARSHDEEQAAAHTGVLRMRGLPFSAGKEDILDFFKEFSVTEESIHITFNFDGRPTGEAYVEFAGPRESEAAMAKNRKMLGSRYIELFPSTHQELNEALAKGR